MTYRFDNCELDDERRLLVRQEQPIGMEPKAFDVLVYLVANRERVVSKDDLLDQFWADTFVGDAALNRCIMLVRKAVGDTSNPRRLIETHHRRGFRFIAPVESVHPQPA